MICSKICEQMIEFNQNDTNWSQIPLRALSLSTRHQLSQYLNAEQYIPTSKGLSRDYRGLAQLMGFSYAIISSICRTTDPFNSLLERYQNRSDATFDQLIGMLEQIERFDIIDDMTPSLVEDAKHCMSGRQLKKSSDQRPDLTSNGVISMVEPMVTYDAYVCYADQDFEFVQLLTRFLESPKIGLRLFIRDRDMSLGSWAYESFAQVIDQSCRRVLIVLSPDFLQCPECDFQTAFATGLAIEQRNRKLIPIIYKRCDLPPIVRMLTKIDMTRSTDATDWSWNRLVNSIKSNVVNDSIVYRQNSGHKPTLLQLPSIPSDPINECQIVSIDSNNESLISLPSVCPTPTAPPLVTTQSSICSSINSETSDKSENCESLPILSSKDTKKLNSKKWIQTFKQKFKY